MNDETSAVDELDLDNNFHPLFPQGPTARPDYKAERFDRIRVFRVTANGPKQIPYEFLPSQLRDAQSFVKLLGGGVFELWAIKLPSGQLYAKRTHDFDAPVRTTPIFSSAGTGGTTPETPAAPVAPPMMAGMPPLPPGTDPMMTFYLWQSVENRKEAEQRAREEREREDRRRDREEARASEDRRNLIQLIGVVAPLLIGNKQELPELLKGLAAYTHATNPPPVAPAQSAMGVIKESLELNKMLDDRAKDLRPDPPEESLSQTVTTILGAVAPLMANTPNNGNGSSIGATPSAAESVARVVGAVAS